MQLLIFIFFIYISLFVLNFTTDIYVPPEQIIDTVQIFFIKNRQRKISLRFLAWYLLKEDIQVETHDSIEDARTVMALF